MSTAVKLGQSRREATQLRQTNNLLAQTSPGASEQPMLGRSAPMLQVKALIDKAAPTDANVLILGENGTGKELVARQLRSNKINSYNFPIHT